MFKLNTITKFLICSLLFTSFMGFQSCKSENKTKTEQVAPKTNAKKAKKGKANQNQKPKIKNINPTKFAELMKKPNAVILDVRTPEEVKEGIIEGAKVIDFNAPDFKAQVKKLDKSKQYLIYCRSGNRSKSAAIIFRNNGFKKVFNLAGGYEKWQEVNKAKK